MVKREGTETFAHIQIVELIYILLWGMVGVGSEGGVKDNCQILD